MTLMKMHTNPEADIAWSWKRLPCIAWLLLLAAWSPSLSAAPQQTQPSRIPVIYCTDLFHPHDDPDDHFDLATLFALPELDVKAILLEQGDKQVARPGTIPVKQMLRLTARRIPSATGLAAKLKSADDTGLDQPKAAQGAVDLLLKALREAKEPVTIIATGSARDVCAAFNREPALFRKNVGRVYLVIGNADDGGSEWNVDLDPKAYAGLLRSALPLYWMPCMPMSGSSSNTIYSSFWKFRQGQLLDDAPPRLQNFFIYALQTLDPKEIDPMKALAMDLHPWRPLVWSMERNMWSTAALLHASGRQMYQTGTNWMAASSAPSGAQAREVFSFIPVRVQVDEAGRTSKDLADPAPNAQMFQITDRAHYGEAMRESLHDLFRRFPVASGAGG